MENNTVGIDLSFSLKFVLISLFN